MFIKVPKFLQGFEIPKSFQFVRHPETYTLQQHSLGLDVHPCAERRPATLRTVHGCAGVHRGARRRDPRCDMRNLPSGARTHRRTMRDTRNHRARHSTHPAGTDRRPPWVTCIAAHPKPGSREYIPPACTVKKKRRERNQIPELVSRSVNMCTRNIEGGQRSAVRR